MKFSIASLTLFASLLLPRTTSAQVLTFPNPNIDYVFPAGGQRGTSVEVEIGSPAGGLQGASKIIIDGPPGITVGEVKSVNDRELRAKLIISPEAVPGRRFLRVVGGSNGMSNFRYFFVSTMTEIREEDRGGANDAPRSAQRVSTPAVINGQIGKAVDVDCYRFAAKKGQKIVAAVLAHHMDSIQKIGARNWGYLDTSMEVLDARGNILHAADDTLGLDPALEFSAPADGDYIIRLQSLGYKGSTSSVYRLTLGDVPYPTHAFPPGARRATSASITLGGLNMPQPVRIETTIDAKGSYPLAFVGLPHNDATQNDGRDFPILRGDESELMEAEPNNERAKAEKVAWPATVNGRIDRPGDEDWYRIALKKGAGIVACITAQRFLASPIDTVIEIQDGNGKKLTENDDGKLFAHPNQCAHDFASADSWATFRAPADGDYFIRVRDQSGIGGPHAVYRLDITELKPDFMLYQWPDAVPIWGLGTTASFIVECYQWGGLKGELQLRIEGLPAGWKGSAVPWSTSAITPYNIPNGNRAILTITAPADARPGDLAPFRVFGKLVHEGKSYEKEAQYLTLYGGCHNDRMFLRNSPQARAVVADFLDSWPEVSVKEITATPGATVNIPVKIRHAPGKERKIGLVVNGPTVAANCGLCPPLQVPTGASEFNLPLNIRPDMHPGTIGIVVSRSWRSDIRAGRPGPCSSLLLLHVQPKK